MNIYDRKMDDIIQLIRDYQNTVEYVISIFKQKFDSTDLLEDWYTRKYPQVGSIPEFGITRYAFHGIGLAVSMKNKYVDFDFADLPERRHDGFDLWRLKGFVKNNDPRKYGKYLDDKKLENDFNLLIEQGVIKNPKLKNFTSLYFFTESISA
ncbi:MAG: hypothetical protein JWO03_881 [Bacteroidetes bacterium]|nr:hypothetical protein [Bacteroidota bacterium]